MVFLAKDRIYLLFTILVPLALASACGKFKDEYKNLRTSGQSQDAQAAQKIQLELTGAPKPGDATASRLYKLRSRLRIPRALQGSVVTATKDKVGVRLTLRNQMGMIFYSKIQEHDLKKTELEWTLHIDGAEGFYDLSLELLDPSTLLPESVEAWKTDFELDTTLPQLAVEAVLTATTDQGLRPVSVNIQVTNETQVSCQAVSIEQPALKEPRSLILQPEQVGPDPRSHRFLTGTIPLADISPSNASARVRCTDRAGNQNESVQPIVVQGTRSLSLRARAVGGVGRPVGSAQNSPTFTFVHSPIISIAAELVDGQNGQKVADAVVETEKPTMRLFVTETMPTNVDALLANRSVLWTQGYTPLLQFPLSGETTGVRSLYVSLVRFDFETKKNILVSSQVLALYRDDSPPQLEWADNAPQFISPKQATPLSLKLRKLEEGAPLAAPMQVEYSVDGRQWIVIPVTESTAPEDPSLLVLTALYPLNVEADLRLRIKAEDLAGNLTVSAVSPRLMGRDGLRLDVTSAQRSSCLSNGSPGFKLQAWLGSSSLCRKADVNGQLAGYDHVSLLLQNQGQVLPQFFATSEIVEGMGYKVVIDGQEQASGRYTPPDLFRLSSSTIRLLQFPMRPEWLAAQKIELVFDTEASGALSTLNSCYAESAPYPRLVIQDKAQNILLKGTSPFACERDTILVP